jgi:predicted transcriptional regulator
MVARGGYLNSMMRKAIEREEVRESFRQEALASWADYQATGLHLTGDEVQAWLSIWGAEAGSELPSCHEYGCRLRRQTA